MKAGNLVRRAIGGLRRAIDPRARLVKRVMAIKRARAEAPFVYRDDPGLSLIMLSFNHRDNVLPILQRLRLTRADELIVCEDGSIDGSEKVWLRYLTRPNDFLIRSNDIHEIRAYNRAAHLARGKIFCILQDDDIPPPDGRWVEHALALFERYPRLGVLGAYQGWFLDFAGPAGSIRQKVFGDGETDIPFIDPVLGIPFMFVEGTSIGPIFYRRDVFHALGGFNLCYSRPGEPGIVSDHEFCMRAWLSGWHVGLLGPFAFQRHVGGQGTKIFGRLERKRNLEDNMIRIKETYADRIEAIRNALDELNQGLHARH